jgi:hypothetical protein
MLPDGGQKSYETAGKTLTGQRRSDLTTFLVRYINNNLPKKRGSSRQTPKRVTCQKLSQRNNGYQIIGQRFFADELKILDYYKGNEGRSK